MNWAQDSGAQGDGLERNGEGQDVHLCASYVSHCLNTFAANLSQYTFSWTRSFSSTVESPLKVVGHEGCAYTATNGDRNVSGSDEADEEGDSLSQDSHSTGIESQSEATDDGFGPHEFSGGVMHHRFAVLQMYWEECLLGVAIEFPMMDANACPSTMRLS